MVGSSRRRAVSPVFGYVLTLAVTAVLVGGLIVASGVFVGDQRERTAESELRVVGQQISADIAAVDRLARTDGATDTAIGRSLPERVVGSHYTVEVVGDGEGPTNPYLRLSTSSPQVTVEVGIASKEPVTDDVSVSGGDTRVVYENGEVVLRDR